MRLLRRNALGVYAVYGATIVSGLVVTPIALHALGDQAFGIWSFVGSITIYLQNKSPGKDKESNWLPAPAGPFVMMMRLYWPKEKSPSIINGTWKPPGVKQVK